MPTLVIVIPTKNRRMLLERALESVWSQSYRNYRVVIINDGSTDNTRTYLDSLTDPRIQSIHHETSRGVNAARNAALRTLQPGEWAVPLDDDDLLLPDALQVIADTITATPATIGILCFNTIIRTTTEEYTGGRDFLKGEMLYEPSYLSLMTGEGLRVRGENRPVWKWTLFPTYLFAEDVNGFEGEWWMLVGRDGVGIRYVPEATTIIDWRHTGEHLSHVAARRNPASFVAAYRRILVAHKTFYNEHLRYGRAAAFSACKLAVRAVQPFTATYFLARYVQYTLRAWL